MSVACYLSFTGELLWEIRWSTERRCGVVSSVLTLYALSALPAEEGRRAASAILQRMSKTEKTYVNRDSFGRDTLALHPPSGCLPQTRFRPLQTSLHFACSVSSTFSFHSRHVFRTSSWTRLVARMGDDINARTYRWQRKPWQGGLSANTSSSPGVNFNIFERMVFSQLRWGSLRLDSRVCSLRPRESSSGWFKAIPTVVRPLCLR